MGHKEKWNEPDVKCEHCGSVIKRVRGFNKQNIRRLVSFKWSSNEFIITFLLICIVMIGVIYMFETKTCRTWVNEQKPMYTGTLDECNTFCSSRCYLIHNNDQKNTTDLNLTNFNFNPIK